MQEPTNSPSIDTSMPSVDVEESPIISEEDLKNDLKTKLANPDNLEAECNKLFEDLLEVVIEGIAFELHEISRLGGVPVMSEEDSKQFAVAEKYENDIFGLPHAKTAPDCCCPICNRSLSALVFAPHLAKCLGLGRNSSRIASRRIANNCKADTIGTSDDDEDGLDKSKLNKKFENKKKKEKKEKNGVRKIKTLKPVNDKNNIPKILDDHNANTKFEITDTKS